MRIQAISSILNIYIIFLTNQIHCYYLDLDNNRETTHITREFFSKKYNVTSFNELTLRAWEITNIDEDSFNNMIMLENLDLSNNKVEHLPPNVFSSLSSLEELRLKSNKIQNLDVNLFKNLKELTLLDLHSNNINRIDKNLFTNLKKLKTLYLYSNKITVIEPGTFDNNLQLQYLDLFDNQITEIKNGAFTKMTGLEKLYISVNRIEKIEINAFPPNLIELLLQENRLQYLDHRIITNLKKLKYAVLYKNPWNCDMKLKQLIIACQNINFLLHKFYEYPACSIPERLATKTWNELVVDTDFPSAISITIEPSATLAKGDVVTLSCHVNPTDASENSSSTKLGWVYEDNTSIVGYLAVNGRSFNYETENNGGRWGNLTIKGVQESDGRLCKCVLYLDGEIVDEKSQQLVVA